MERKASSAELNMARQALSMAMQRTETAEQAETLVIKHLAAKEAERCAASDLVASTSKDGDIAINQAKSADERSDGFANEALLCRSCNTGCAAL